MVTFLYIRVAYQGSTQLGTSKVFGGMILPIIIYNEADDAGVSSDDEDEDKHSKTNDDSTPSSATRVAESMSKTSLCELTKQAQSIKKMVEKQS